MIGISRLDEIHNRLRKITENCRPDMHEPDEQGIECRVVGDKLDNAMGEDIRGGAIENGYQEIIIILKRDDSNFVGVEKFNLADLIALARR